ncbi:MAG: signal recognition particle-docking protein FtsY [Polyangiaceae bacterium]|nr:signal recognition particle-docking protein FtsY [Polyangiaceae bacterium]
MEILLVLIGVVVFALVVYFATKKKPEQLPPAETSRLREGDKTAKRTAESRATDQKPERRSERPPKTSERPPKPSAEPTRGAPPAEPAPEELAPAVPEPEAAAAAGVAAPIDRSAPAVPRRLLEPTHDARAIRRGLTKSREASGFFGRLRALFKTKPEIGAELTIEIEDVLLGSDVGVATTETLLARVREELTRGEILDEKKVWRSLREEAVRVLKIDGAVRPLECRAKPTVILFVGVNGSGKTTTIGKLATRMKASGIECVLAAGDTFRAAAVQQLAVWGERVGCEVVRGKDGADPSSVIFDSIKKAEEVGADVVLADTAGRLHTKANLMGEMKKIAKTAAKALDGAPHEILLVIDATTGQNALAQAREFQEALALTGIVLTKLDGTAKGGMVLGISDALRLPVRLVGLGERPSDLHEFDPEEFVEALLGKETDSTAR